MLSRAHASPRVDATEGATQLRGFFYPLAQSRLLGHQPLERSLAGQRIALYRDASGQARAIDARCPHRGANLADGRVVDGCLVCPYHGWRFASDGRCVQVPSHPDRPIPARSTARTFQVVEQQGLIWARLDGDSAAPMPPRFPIADNPAYRSFIVEARYPGPADWWMENFIDISHVPFVHQRTFGGSRPAVSTGPVERRTDELGFSAQVRVRYEYGLLARLFHGTIRPYTEDAHFDMTVPATVYLQNDMGQGRRQEIALFATPEDSHTTRVILVVWRNYLKWVPMGDLLGQIFTRVVLNEDRKIAQRSVSTLQHPEQAVMAADGPAQELIRLLRLWRERERERERCSSAAQLQAQAG